jgi:hypothetical protein
VKLCAMFLSSPEINAFFIPPEQLHRGIRREAVRDVSFFPRDKCFLYSPRATPPRNSP